MCNRSDSSSLSSAPILNPMRTLCVTRHSLQPRRACGSYCVPLAPQIRKQTNLSGQCSRRYAYRVASFTGYGQSKNAPK